MEEFEDFRTDRRRERFSLYILIQGSVRLRVNGAAYVRMAPCLICLNNCDRVQLLHSNMLLAKSVHFDPAFINRNMTIERISGEDYPELAGHYDFFNLRPFLHAPGDLFCSMPVNADVIGTLGIYFARMRHELTAQRDHLWSCRARTMLMRIILLVEEVYESQVEQKGTPSPRREERGNYIADILDYIHLNYAKKIRIEQFCETDKISKNTLMKDFKLATGLTISEYIIEYRMKVAIKALRFTSLTIDEIAKESGFNYGSYFIRQFLKRYRMTPTEFRNHEVEQRKSDFQNKP